MLCLSGFELYSRWVPLGYVSTEVHLPLIAHKQAVMPHYKNSGLISM